METSIPSDRITLEKQIAWDAELAKRMDLLKQRKPLEDELSRIDYAIAQSRARCGALYNADAPIFSLPDEITVLIFWFSVCSVDQPRFCMEEQRLMEVVVSHVCQRWRIIALNQSDLWSTFHVNASQEKSRLPLDRLDAYLERSKNKLLDLSFRFEPLVADEQQSQESLQLLFKILPHHKRWYRLHIVALDSADILMEVIYELESLYVPNLVHCTLCTGCSDVVQEWDWWLGIRAFGANIFSAGAPRLSSLLLDGTAVAAAMPPSLNLTTLRIERCRPKDKWVPWTTDALLQIFTLPTLINLSMAGDFQPETFQSWSAGLRSALAPRLQNLRIARAAEESNFMMEVLQFIEAPQLTCMVLYGLDYTWEQTNPRASPFPSLKTLILDECTFSRSSLVAQLAQLTPSVTRLSISQRFFFVGNYSALDWLPEHQGVWPNVEVITLDIKELALEEYERFIKGTACRRYTFAMPPIILSDWKRLQPGMLARLEEKINIIAQVDENPHKWPPGEDLSGILVPFDDPFPRSGFSPDDWTSES